MDCEMGLDALRRQPMPEREHARVVDEDVEPRMRRPEVCREAADRIGDRQINGPNLQILVTGLGCDLVTDDRALGCVPTREDHMGSKLRKSSGGLLADPGSWSGHDAHAAVEDPRHGSNPPGGGPT